MRAAKLKGRLELFISEVWNDGDADAAGRYLAPRSQSPPCCRIFCI
jgi:hypothetical protein